MTYQLFPIGPTVTVHDEVEFNQLGSRSAPLSDGGVIIGWYDGRGPSIFDGADFKIRRFDSDGNPTGPERVIYDNAGDVNWNPFVTGLTGGGYAVAWQPQRDDDDPHAQIAIFDAEDNRVTTVSAPVPAPEGSLGLRSSGVGNEWVLSALDDGGFVLTWAASSTHSHYAGFHTREAWFSQRFDAEGNAVADLQQISDWAYLSGFRVVAGASLGDGYALLMTLPTDQTERDQASAAVQIFDADGTPMSARVLLDPDTSGLQTPRDIATLADGSLVATWHTSAWVDEGGGTKLRRLDGDGTPLDPGARIEGAGGGAVRVNAMEDGGWLVSWQMPTGASGGRAFDLRAQRYDSDGNTVGEVTQIASVRSNPDRTDFGFSGFGGSVDFIPLEAGPLLAVMPGHVSDSPEDGPQRGDHDVFIRPFAPEVLGSGGDDVLEAGSIGTALFGLGGNDTLIGGPGDDYLIGGPGDDLLLGGEGTNMAVFSGRPADYDIARGPDGRLTVTDLREGSPDGTDTLENIALLQFAGRGAFDREIVAVADLELDATMTGQVTGPQGQPMAGVMLTLSAEGWPDQTASSDAEGGFTFSMAEGVAGRLDAAQAYDTATGPAITAGDALDALRIAVGLEPSFGPAQAQNYIAADINGDGRVTAGDALDILRAAVGLEAEHAPRWVFLDSATDWGSVVQDGLIGHDEGITFDGLSGMAEMALTGILIGSLTEVA